MVANNESQNLDAASQRIVRDMGKITEGKLTWEDSQEYVTEGIGHLVNTADHTDKEVKCMHQTVKAMHTDMKKQNGHKVVLNLKKGEITTDNVRDMGRVLVMVCMAVAFGFVVWEYVKAKREAPVLMKQAFKKAICEDKHGPDCTDCLDHPH